MTYGNRGKHENAYLSIRNLKNGTLGCLFLLHPPRTNAGLEKKKKKKRQATKFFRHQKIQINFSSTLCLTQH